MNSVSRMSKLPHEQIVMKADPVPLSLNEFRINALSLATTARSSAAVLAALIILIRSRNFIDIFGSS